MSGRYRSMPASRSSSKLDAAINHDPLPVTTGPIAVEREVHADFANTAERQEDDLPGSAGHPSSNGCVQSTDLFWPANRTSATNTIACTSARRREAARTSTRHLHVNAENLPAKVVHRQGYRPSPAPSRERALVQAQSRIGAPSCPRLLPTRQTAQNRRTPHLAPISDDKIGKRRW